MSDEPALQTRHLTVNYHNTPVLWDIDVAVPAGKLCAIIGPNGAGKSTFIKTALGLVKPINGKVEFFGKSLKQMRRFIAYVPQRESVDWDFPITVLDLVLMGRYGRMGLFRRPREADRQAAREQLARVGMERYADRQISQLSGGQQQRVFIARALMQEADIYFMDEPFAGVDHTTERVLVDVLKELEREGKTLFVVHHDLNTVENYYDWVLFLNMRMVASGPTDSTFTPENLAATYGKSHAILDEAVKISQTKTSGMQ